MRTLVVCTDILRWVETREERWKGGVQTSDADQLHQGVQTELLQRRVLLGGGEGGGGGPPVVLIMVRI